MNPTSLAIATMRVSRLLAALALLTGVAVLTAWAYDFIWLRPYFTELMTPLSAVCVVLLALSCLLAGWRGRIVGVIGQLLGLLALTFALQAAAQTWFGVWFNTDLALFSATVQRVFEQGFEFPGRMAGATSLMFAACALALIVARFYGRLAATIYVVAAALGLLLVAISLVGFVLGSDVLASLGLDRTPTTSATLTAGVVLAATLLQRQDTGWLPVLLGSSSAGRSARWPFVGTMLVPLAFALIALTGVRAGYYGLNFAFALLVAATCIGLSLLVLWNAARQERADTRATRARDAMQLAANRLRLAKSATGIQMWEWTPATREWFSVDGEERLDPSSNQELEAGLERCLRDGAAEFEFRYRRSGRDDCWLLAKCWREQREHVAIVAGITLDITERKLAAIALEASETRLGLAARAMPGFVYDWNYASGRIVRTSGIEQMLGYRVAEASPLNHWWEELIHPEDRALSRPARVTRAAGPDSDIDILSCEYRVRHKNGSYVWIWDHCVLVRDANKHLVRVVGSVLDITERKEYAARLAASEHRFKATLLATAGIIWTHSPDGRAVGEQPSWSAFTGQTTDELQGLGWTQAVHPEDIPATLEAWRRALESGDDLVLIQRVRRRDGVYRNFSVHAVPVTDERGQIVEWVGSHTDITEQREAQQRVRESLRRLELALDAASVGMWDWELDTDRMTWTRQTHLITGVSEGAFDGHAQAFFKLLPPNRNYAETIRREVSRPEDVREFELELRRPDGQVRWLQNRATAIADANGRVRRIVGTLRDITQRKGFEVEREALLAAERAARSELGAAAQAKDEFLATISHELRTPLNAILGWTTLLQRPNVDATTIADGLKVIERNARAQTQLLGDLLDANQLMSGKLSLHFEPMDLNDAVRATLDSLRVTIATRKVRIESALTDAPLHVMGDSGRLQQIASNLISNALKFTPPDGVVAIRTGVVGDGVFLEVRDSGEGISAEFLPHIFEKFRQADGGSARKHAGLGLGLAIAKQLAESHGGAISVESEGKGKGAMFRVRLPLLRPGAGESEETAFDRTQPKSNEKPLAGLRILAVDDEMDSREYLARLLAEQGAEIVSVSSAAEALQELAPERAPFDLLVSDIGMPGSTGYDLIEAIRANLQLDARLLPAVALTAFSRPQDTVTAIQKGFQKHLAKPVQVGRLIGAIRQLTGLNRVKAPASARKH